MQNGLSYLAYEELIQKGWFISQYQDLAHDLEILERYGHLEREQRRRLLKLAREIQENRTTCKSGYSDSGRAATHRSPTQPIR